MEQNTKQKLIDQSVERVERIDQSHSGDLPAQEFPEMRPVLPVLSAPAPIMSMYLLSLHSCRRSRSR